MNVKSVLKKVGKAIVWPFRHLWPIIKPAATELFKTALGKIVLEVVSTLQSGDLTSTERHAAAVREIVATARKEGIEFKDSMVNFLIELAVQALKNGFKP